MIVLDEAVVLQVREYSETSQIAAFWTRGHGRMTGIAKGVRRGGRAAFDGPFEPAARYELGFYPRPRGEGLAILSESSLRERYPSVRETLEGWWAWSEAAEAILALTQEMDPHPGLGEALEAMLKGIPGKPDALVRFFMALLEASGHAPTLDRCVGCGAILEEGRPAGFSFWRGGAVCRDCAAGFGPVAAFPASLRRALAGGPGVPSWRPAENLLARAIAHLAGGPLSASSCRDRSRRTLRRLRGEWGMAAAPGIR